MVEASSGAIETSGVIEERQDHLGIGYELSKAMREDDKGGGKSVTKERILGFTGSVDVPAVSTTLRKNGLGTEGLLRAVEEGSGTGEKLDDSAREEKVIMDAQTAGIIVIMDAQTAGIIVIPATLSVALLPTTTYLPTSKAGYLNFLSPSSIFPPTPPTPPTPMAIFSSSPHEDSAQQIPTTTSESKGTLTQESNFPSPLDSRVQFSLSDTTTILGTRSNDQYLARNVESSGWKSIISLPSDQVLDHDDRMTHDSRTNDGYQTRRIQAVYPQHLPLDHPHAISFPTSAPADLQSPPPPTFDDLAEREKKGEEEVKQATVHPYVQKKLFLPLRLSLRHRPPQLPPSTLSPDVVDPLDEFRLIPFPPPTFSPSEFDDEGLGMKSGMRKGEGGPPPTPRQISPARFRSKESHRATRISLGMNFPLLESKDDYSDREDRRGRFGGTLGELSRFRGGIELWVKK